MEYTTNSNQETQKMAREIIDQLIRKETSGALVLALEGELGAGKTTFVQGLAKALKIKEKVLSPTFVIMRKFAMDNLRFKNFYHFDCYRLEGENDLDELGFAEIINNKENLVAIEWAGKIKSNLPKDAVWIYFEHGGEDERKIKI